MAERKDNQEFLTISNESYSLAVRQGSLHTFCRQFGSLEAPCFTVSKTRTNFTPCGICQFSSCDETDLFKKLTAGQSGRSEEERTTYMRQCNIYDRNKLFLGGITFQAGMVDITIDKSNYYKGRMF